MNTVERQQTLGEEIANSISHGVGFLMAITAIPILIISASQHSKGLSIYGALVFGITASLLYLTSTLYHSLAQNRAKRLFQLLDHSAIYLLIAGTYTPFTLGVLHGYWGRILLVLIWLMALGGILIKSFGGLRYERLSTLLYLAMGWSIVCIIKPAWQLIPPQGLLWLFMGGVLYTLGVVFFVYERKKYFHFLWHLFVISGTTCHFFAVLWYAA